MTKLLRKIVGHSLILGQLKHSSLSRRQRLVNLLRHVNTTTPFYKGQFTSFLEAEQELTDEEFFYAYSHLPITEKAHLKQHNADFMCDALQEKTDLLPEGKTPDVKTFIKHAVIKKDFFATLSTGGSSGVPAFRYVDYADSNVFAQSFLHSFKLNGWKTGESFVVYYPLKSYFTNTYAEHSQTLDRFFGFTMVPFEEVTKESVVQLLDTLRQTKSTLLVIFPCVLQRVAQIMHDEKIEPFENLQYINVSGEFFLDCSKNFIQKMFPDSDIQSTYGAVEFGEIAHQKGLSSFDYDAFDEFAYLEQGPRNTILVTPYNQKAFPLIRYRIEDMGQIVNNEDGSQSIECLEGKNTDYLIGGDDYLYYASFFNQFINALNKKYNDSIIHFMARHDLNTEDSYLQANLVLSDDTHKDKIEKETQDMLEATFSNYQHLSVNFPAFFEHDYTRKFKIIGEGNGLAEVVGGYYQRKAS